MDVDESQDPRETSTAGRTSRIASGADRNSSASLGSNPRHAASPAPLGPAPTVHFHGAMGNVNLGINYGESQLLSSLQIRRSAHTFVVDLGSFEQINTKNVFYQISPAQPEVQGLENGYNDSA